MLFLAALFTLGTLWFWIALLTISILIIAFDASEHEGRAFATLLIFAGAVIYFNPALATAVRNNPFLILWGLLGYLALGVVTAFVKWYFFLLNVRDALRENPLGTRQVRNSNYEYGRKGDGGEPEFIKVPNEETTVRGRRVQIPIKVSHFKARIVGWMTYWPWVALWTLLDEPVRRAFQRIYVACAGRLQAMADRITGAPATSTRIEPDKPWPRQ